MNPKLQSNVVTEVFRLSLSSFDLPEFKPVALHNLDAIRATDKSLSVHLCSPFSFTLLRMCSGIKVFLDVTFIDPGALHQLFFLPAVQECF